MAAKDWQYYDLEFIKKNTKLIKRMARYYIWHKNATQQSVAEHYNLTVAEVGKMFNKSLPVISLRLFKKVKNKAKNNSTRILNR